MLKACSTRGQISDPIAVRDVIANKRAGRYIPNASRPQCLKCAPKRLLRESDLSGQP